MRERERGRGKTFIFIVFQTPFEERERESWNVNDGPSSSVQLPVIFYTRMNESMMDQNHFSPSADTASLQSNVSGDVRSEEMEEKKRWRRKERRKYTFALKIVLY